MATATIDGKLVMKSLETVPADRGCASLDAVSLKIVAVGDSLADTAKAGGAGSLLFTRTIIDNRWAFVGVVDARLL